MTEHSDDLPSRPHQPGGVELDRQIELTRRQLSTLTATTDKLGAGTTIEEALAALSLTIEELEVTAEELRAQNDELIATRHKVERERQRFQELFDLAPEAYVLTNRKGIVQQANRQAERLLGRHVGELLGKPLAVFVQQDDRRTLRRLIDDMPEGTVRGLDVRVEPRHGEPCPVSVTVRRGRDADQDAELRWMLADASAHEIARTELSTRLQEARHEVDTRKHIATWQSTLLGASAHDLRTPLAVISGAVETLLEHWDDLDPDRSRSLLEATLAQATKLRHVLGGLMEVSRLQLTSKQTHREQISLRGVVESTLATLDPVDHELVVDVPPGLTAAIDATQFERTVENLVANAVTHTPPGTTIRIAAGPAPTDPTGLLLVVEDDGPGVDDEIKALIFEPFVHLADDTAGSGLGLAIVAMFAAFHDGRAWVEDREGGGAAFHVLLGHALPPAEAPVDGTDT